MARAQRELVKTIENRGEAADDERDPTSGVLAVVIDGMFCYTA